MSLPTNARIPLAITLLAALALPAAGGDRTPPAAKGEVVAGLGRSVMYLHHARNGDYWFGSNDCGVYRYDGKTLVNFTTRDGLPSNRVRGLQEDKSGNVYVTTYEGISKFDGRAFETLPASAETDPKGWRLHADDLWFVGPPDAGVVFRYDGTTPHRLKFPRTRLGDEHLERMPRSKFPNAIYSPYDVYCIVRDTKGHLWFGSSSVGVCRYDGRSFDWLTDATLAEAPVRSILEDKSGNFWFTYSGHRKLDGPLAVKDFGKTREGKQGTIVEGMSIVEDGDGVRWTAALRSGVYRHEGGRRVQYSLKDGDTPVEVFAVYKDNKNVVWLGTHNGGAYRFNGKGFEKFTP